MKNHKLNLTILIVNLLIFRICYGLSQNFWHEDVVQIYLLGLKYFTTGSWPFFGPDVVHTNQQIPGGLQSILIAVPLWIWPVAESPVIFVNILSLFGIGLLAFFMHRRFSSQPAWFWLVWLGTLPMTLQFSTNTYNPSYLLLPAILFFIGFFERVPQLRQLQWSALTSGIAMGLSLGFIFQLHLSWPLLAPYLAATLVLRQPKMERLKLLSGMILGALVISLSLFPTIGQYGLSTLWSAGSSNSEFNIANAQHIGSTILRVVSIASYEFLGFNLGSELAERRSIITSHPLLVISAIVMGLALLTQVIMIIRYWVHGLKSRKMSPELALLGLSCIWAALLFLMTPRPPAFRNIYILFPVAALAAAWLIDAYQQYFRSRVLWAVVVGSSVLFHALVGIKMWPDISLHRDRDRVQNAIDQKDYRILGERRPGHY
jgi:hypothetical protein